MSSIRTLALSAVVAMGTAASSLGQANPPVSNTVSNVNCGGGSGTCSAPSTMPLPVAPWS